MDNSRLEKIGVRKIDELGRVVIPAEIRKSFDIKEGDPLEFVINDSKNIIIRKYIDVCTFCGSYEYLLDFKDKFICKNCVKQLSDVLSYHVDG